MEMIHINIEITPNLRILMERLRSKLSRNYLISQTTLGRQMVMVISLPMFLIQYQF